MLHCHQNHFLIMGNLCNCIALVAILSGYYYIIFLLDLLKTNPYNEVFTSNTSTSRKIKILKMNVCDKLIN